MNYSNIIEDFTWSYSRLNVFEDCKYKFLLSYIYEEEKKKQFFSEFGKLVHEAIEQKLNGWMDREEALQFYFENFPERFLYRVPSAKIYYSYYNDGYNYLKDKDFPYTDIKAVEWQSKFKIENRDFVGIIDNVSMDGDSLIIVDNKSRNLKPRSTHGKYTKTDEELDHYLRQLYLYSIPVKERFGRYPDRLEFNCFREGELISEPFSESKFETVKNWAVNLTDTIIHNDSWEPDMDEWKCSYLCDCNDSCEYYSVMRENKW